MATKKPQQAVSSSASSGEFDLLKAEKLGRYILQRKLGAGGMGAVYLALDKELNRLVALKVLPPDKAENEILVKRFKAEAQAVAQLRHENIVQVYESGETDGYHYIALEYVEGTDVHRLIKKRGRLPVRRATEIINQLALALEHANTKGIVHRDIKPANMLINQAGVVKLTDMGLARMLDDTEVTSITRAGTTVGTVDYMAPEQARSSKAADTRSDIYSLGCAWYHMLTGSPPYPEGSVTNKLQAHAVAKIPDPRDINEAVPETVVAVIQRMMSKKPEDRHQSPQELLDDLKAVKASKRDISATDLAALANEAEEETPPSSGRSRSEEDSGEHYVSRPQRRSSREIDAEDDDDAPGAYAPRSKVTEEESSDSARDRKRKKGSNGQHDSLPPREPRKLSDVEAEEKKGINTEYLAFAGLACGLLLAVGAVWYVISSVGSAMSPATDKQVNLIDLAQQHAEEREQEAESAPAASTEATNATQESATQPTTTQDRNGNGSVASRPGELPAIEPGQGQTTADSSAVRKYPVIKVVDAGEKTDENSAHTIGEALEKNSAKELIIELHTSGLLRWDQPIVVDGRTLVIRKAQEASGMVLVASSGALAQGLISIRKGELILEGLHFGLLGYDLPGEQDLTLIKTVDANLAVSGCSFTIEESRGGVVTLSRMTQTGERRSRSTWEQSLIRGAFWRPFEVSATRCSLVVHGCWFFTGNEPILTINHAGSVQGQRSFDGTSDQADRDFAFADSYLYCGDTPFVLHNTRQEITVPSTLFRMNRTCFVASRQPQETPFLRVLAWPENVLATAGKGKLSQLDWISESSQFAGWTQRLHATANRTRTVLIAENDEQWREVWGNPGLEGTWKTGGPPAPKTASLAWATGQESVQEWKLAASAVPHADALEVLSKVSLPPLPEPTWRASVLRGSALRKPPAEDFPTDAPKITIDATKVNLGEALAGQEIPQTALVEVRGYGLRTSGPIRVSGKRLKLQFVSENGRPQLTFRPIPAKGENGSKSVPWIIIENGQLILDGGLFRLDPPAKNPMPESWIEARNSDLRVQRCYVTAPDLPDSQLTALIRLQGAEKSRRSAVVLDTYLQYGGLHIDADLRSHTLQVQNSVLVSQTHILQARHAGQQAAPGRFDLVKSTFSARLGTILFDVAAPPADSKPFVNAYVTECVFAPAVPVEKGSATPTTAVAAKFPPEELPRRVWWWGSRNGYSPQVARLFQERKLRDHWPQFWGPGHELEPLLTNEGVMLQAETLDPKKLRPSSFALFENSQAVQWGAGETPLGADSAKLDRSGLDGDAKPAPGDKPATTAPRF